MNFAHCLTSPQLGDLGSERPAFLLNISIFIMRYEPCSDPHPPNLGGCKLKHITNGQQTFVLGSKFCRQHGTEGKALA